MNEELSDGLFYLDELNKIVYTKEYIIGSGKSINELRSELDYAEFLSDDTDDNEYILSKGLRLFSEDKKAFCYDLIAELNLEDEINKLIDQFPNYVVEIEQELEYIFKFEHNILLFKMALILKKYFDKKELCVYMMRGSAVSSFILYLIGLNRINPMKYNMDYKNFWKH